VLTGCSMAQKCSFLASNPQMIHQVDPIKGLAGPTAAGRLESIIVTGTETAAAVPSENRPETLTQELGVRI
jgi:hypothetical protein